MATACLVPALIPDLWHLAAIMKAEKTILLKDEPFSRKSQAHRILLRNVQGTQWFTMPIHPDDRKKPLNQVRVDQTMKWHEQLMKVLRTSYGNSIYFDFYEPEIDADLQKAAESEFLYDVILHLNKRIYRYLELEDLIEKKTEHASTTAFNEAVKDAGSQHEVWIEERGSYYRKLGDVGRARIKQPKFNLPEYRQHFEGFEPGCCLLDLLFQYGPMSFEITDRIEKA